MKKFTFVFVCFLLLLSLSACSKQTKNLVYENEQKENLVYESEIYGFSLTFPDSWEEKYYIEVEDNYYQKGDGTVTVCHKPNDLVSELPKLFTIHVFDSKTKWEEVKEETYGAIPFIKIYEDDDKIFAVSYPTDVPDYGPDHEKDHEKFYEEYQELMEDLYSLGIEKMFTRIKN